MSAHGSLPANTIPRLELLQLAQTIARNTSWHVFPCGKNKAPCISKDDGGRGCLGATTDPDAIAGMFKHRYASLIGVSTGIKSGFDVLDVDVKHAAARAWLIAAQNRIPPTRTYQTRSGGFHLLFRHVEGVHNTESHIARGVDTRGEGGYIVFWYAAGFDCTDHSPVAEWPEWLLEALFYKPLAQPIPPRKVKAYVSSGGNAQNMVDASLRKLRDAAEGSRHAALRAASCTLGGLLEAASLSRADAAEQLLGAVLEAGGARIDRDNAAATIEWGLTKGAQTLLTPGRR